MKQNQAITEKKYSAFITDCFQSKTFDAISLSRKHEVDSSLITTLSNLGSVVLMKKGVYNWIGPYPTQEVIQAIIEAHRERMRQYRNNRAQKKEQQEASDPVPSITEEQAVNLLKSLGGYEIYKIERKQL